MFANDCVCMYVHLYIRISPQLQARLTALEEKLATSKASEVALTAKLAAAEAEVSEHLHCVLLLLHSQCVRTPVGIGANFQFLTQHFMHAKSLFYCKQFVRISQHTYIRTYICIKIRT